MSVTHSLGTTHRATPARRGERLSSLSTLLRLLSPTWRNAGWMLDNAPLSLQETLGEQQFIGWVLGVAGETAMNAVGSFASQPRETRQTLAALVRYYRFDKRPSAWAIQYWRTAA